VVSTRFQNVNFLLRTLVLAGVVGLAGWWTIFLRNKLASSERELVARTAELTRAQVEIGRRDEQIQEQGRLLEERAAEIRQLTLDLAEKQKRIQALEVALALLKVDRRVARLEVLAQGARDGDDPGRVRTTLRFSELDPDGEPLGPGQELTVEGKTIYVESLVIKFEDHYVEQGDPLRGTSLCLFRRLFGENQSPSEGVPLDPAGEQPLAYGGTEGLPALHRALWERFWDYANDPDLAATLGVRALHGEAPFIEARPGKSYRVELRASGGLSIEAE
jgi:hypothetical protein